MKSGKHKKQTTYLKVCQGSSRGYLQQYLANSSWNFWLLVCIKVRRRLRIQIDQITILLHLFSSILSKSLLALHSFE